ncbi:MAG: hypothetical protein M3Q48_17150 [Actinomycetota bacterium]|jgi:hypothetical protein|nr:hypothetical protein [Actinomycetota bacterium]
MLDHVFLAAIGAVRRGLEDALLERHALEERLQVDVLLGDVSWETAYTLPGEGMPPRVQAEIALDWPTWSQATYRSAMLGDPGEDPPELEVELVLRIQRLAGAPDAGGVLSALPAEGPAVLGDALERSGPTVEQHCDAGDAAPQFAVEVSYAGVAPLPEEVLRDVGRLDEHLAPLGRWVASSLVRLADLDLAFLPPELEEGGLR